MATRDKDIEVATIRFWAAAYDLWSVCSVKSQTNTVNQTIITAAQTTLGAGIGAPCNPNSAIQTMVTQIANSSGGSWT